MSLVELGITGGEPIQWNPYSRENICRRVVSDIIRGGETTNWGRTTADLILLADGIGKNLSCVLGYSDAGLQTSPQIDCTAEEKELEAAYKNGTDDMYHHLWQLYQKAKSLLQLYRMAQEKGQRLENRDTILQILGGHYQRTKKAMIEFRPQPARSPKRLKFAA